MCPSPVLAVLVLMAMLPRALLAIIARNLTFLTESVCAKSVCNQGTRRDGRLAKLGGGVKTAPGFESC